MKSKLDFTTDEIESIILKLSNLSGYKKPSDYLNDLLTQVSEFGPGFTFDLCLDVHYMCKKHQKRFWSGAHRRNITDWLYKHGPVTTISSQGDIFETTWSEWEEIKKSDNIVDQQIPQPNDEGNETEEPDTKIDQQIPQSVDVWTWRMLFKVPEEAVKILELTCVKDLLSDSGQIIKKHEGRYLAALFNVLQKKGYIKTSAKNARQIAEALNGQFGTQLKSKTFQEGKREEAANYEDYFRCIPPRK